MPEEGTKEQVSSVNAPSASTGKATSKKTAKKKGAKKKAAKKRPAKNSSQLETAARNLAAAQAIQAQYPRFSVDKALRVPKAILEQNAGKECTDEEAARFVGLKLSGKIQVEINAALKYGYLERPASGRLKLSDFVRKILRPQGPRDIIDGYRKAILNAPEFSDVYKHYRGENLPDQQFFDNALVDTFHIPQAELSKFKSLFIESLQMAQLIDEHDGKYRILDVSKSDGFRSSVNAFKALEESVTVDENDTCFVMMPFALPLGTYYLSVYEPAIRKAGLKPVRADADIYATGKIMDQVWSGINTAKVLLAELTSRNPNVLYELGLAHALKKPVVLVSSNEEDVPFDVRHIRVIYYDVSDPFWGDKLITKVAENILSAIKNPEEAIFTNPADVE